MTSITLRFQRLDCSAHIISRLVHLRLSSKVHVLARHLQSLLVIFGARPRTRLCEGYGARRLYKTKSVESCGNSTPLFLFLGINPYKNEGYNVRLTPTLRRVEQYKIKLRSLTLYNYIISTYFLNM